MKLNHSKRRGFTLVELLVVIVIIAALAGLTAPQVIKMRKRGDLAEATNNAKNLGFSLTEFDTEIGGYPDALQDGTVAAIEQMSGEKSTRVLTGNTSNPYFRQLIEANIIDSEQPFYAKTSYTKRKPDDNMRGREALKAGEVGFGYIMQQDGNSIPVSSRRPVAVTPLKQNSRDGAMEMEPYDGKAIALFGDSSAKQLNIRTRDEKAAMAGGGHLLQTGEDTVWGVDINPTIMPPETSRGGSNLQGGSGSGLDTSGGL